MGAHDGMAAVAPATTGVRVCAENGSAATAVAARHQPSGPPAPAATRAPRNETPYVPNDRNTWTDAEQEVPVRRTGVPCKP